MRAITYALAVISFGIVLIATAHAQAGRPKLPKNVHPTIKAAWLDVSNCMWNQDPEAGIEWCDKALTRIGDARKERTRAPVGVHNYVMLALVNMAARYEKLGDLAKAEQHYNYAIRADSKAFDVFLKRADIYVAQGQGAKAMADIKKAADLRPKDPQPLMARANLYQKAGDKKRAREQAQAAYKLDPVHWDVLTMARAYGIAQ